MDIINNTKNVSLLDDMIIGRVEPNIYAFTTETIPNYMKVGDTYRPVGVRIAEWRSVYPKLKHLYTRSALINNETIFRDYSVHSYLEEIKGRKRLRNEDTPDGVYYSNEFFRNATTDDVDDAIDDIHQSASSNDGRYKLYSIDYLPKTIKYLRGNSFEPRENQRVVIENFKQAFKSGRTNLLMYAVMRFGKSFTAMCCAKEMQAERVLIVTAKADVREEWKKTVESIGNFEGYEFADKENLKSSSSFLRQAQKQGKRIVLFLTLQDLQGNEMKEAHKEVFTTKWDQLLVDETHFGARAECYGKILQTKREEKNELKRQMKQVDTLDDLDVAVKELHTGITIHLSGTPYRILMGSEFDEKDIIAFVQFSDIADAQKEWSDKHKFDDTVNEWDNPYFGFPQMIRFAFLPNQSSLDRLEQLRSEGNTTSFSELLRPESLTNRKDNHMKFIHEDVVLDLMLAIDGAKDDTNVLGFLDNERIKNGKLCRHIVMVLPYCASCDAMEELLTANADKFRNLQDYEIINISGLQTTKQRNIIETTKRHIAQCEMSGRKTITLTVNRMLTGSTVPQWDTMIYLKQTASPEEYDQAIYRLQNPYVTDYAANGDEVPIKYNMKPQTILVDFDPDRMFRLQEHKCQIYNVNVDHNGNSELKRRIEKELEVSPIITLDHNKLRAVTSTNIIDAIRDYSQTKNVVDEAKEIAIDMSLLENEELRRAVSRLNPIDSRKGIIVPSTKRDDDNQGDDVNPQVDGNANHSDGKPANNEQDYVENSLAKQLSSYYALILFFAFLTNDEVSSLKDVIRSIGRSSANKRIATNLGLSADVLRIIQSHSNGFILSALDYKIQNTNSLNHDENKSPMERVNIALAKFGRISSSEVVTPPDIADYMVSLLPESIGNSTEKLLDIASKQAEFTTALIRRFGNGIGNRIYSVCTSMVAYEFTRKVYELLMLPTRHVIHDFTSLDLIIEGNKDYIDYLKNMKFETIIGNPPYQEDGISSRKNPIYNLFYDKAFDISSKVMLITPGRFLYRVGQTPKRWMDDILSNRHIMVAKYYQKSSDVFGPSVEIKGGIVITYRDSDKDFGEIGFFSEYPELRSTIKKVHNHKDFHNGEFSSLISSQGIYKFSEEAFREYPKIIEVQGRGTAAKITSNSFENLPEIFLKDEPADKSDYILMIGRINNRRVYRWIKRAYIQQEETINYYRVLITEANGTGAIGEALSTPIIAEPQTGHTDTFLSIGKFDNAEEAKNCLKYIKTKFSRAMLSTLKATQHNPKDCWKNVPLQDFSTNSDIDWSMDIKEIDNKLYEKYGLDEEERIFIDTKIKSM